MPPGLAGPVTGSHLVCGYEASCSILSTNSQASGFSLNYDRRQRPGKVRWGAWGLGTWFNAF